MGTKNQSSSKKPDPPSGETPKILSIKSIFNSYNSLDEDGFAFAAGRLRWLPIDGFVLLDIVRVLIREPQTTLLCAP
jgi:hypothetical protein